MMFKKLKFEVTKLQITIKRDTMNTVNTLHSTVHEYDTDKLHIQSKHKMKMALIALLYLLRMCSTCVIFLH